MQAYKINIGYTFSLYLHGPYSTELTKDAFQIKEFNKIDTVKFTNKDVEKRFIEFLNIFEKHKDDVEWLEIASSIHLFKTLYSKKDSEIVDMVVNKSDDFRFKKERISEILNEIKQYDFYD